MHKIKLACDPQIPMMEHREIMRCASQAMENSECEEPDNLVRENIEHHHWRPGDTTIQADEGKNESSQGP